MDISKRRILLIAPVFFGYYREIILEIKNMGFEVEYICDAPSNSNISKAIGRINKGLIKRSTDKYFKKEVLPIIENKLFDYVLVIGGMTFAFTPQMIKKIRQYMPNAEFILYLWDSVKNLKYVMDIKQYFNELYSFDRFDCITQDYCFLPLFYTTAYEKIGCSQIKKYTYDCSYVGTAHPQKYILINEMSDKLNSVLKKQFIYHYMPSILKYIFHKLTCSEFKNTKLKDFHFDKVSKDNMMRIFSESKCILDAPQAGQTGLTIRTIECLGAKRKLITTNKDIKNYDFYNEKNILIYDNTVDLKSVFFKTDYEEIPKNIYEKYSLRNWLKTLLS